MSEEKIMQDLDELFEELWLEMQTGLEWKSIFPEEGRTE